jgi:hypothetical protein
VSMTLSLRRRHSSDRLSDMASNISIAGESAAAVALPPVDDKYWNHSCRGHTS